MAYHKPDNNGFPCDLPEPEPQKFYTVVVNTYLGEVVVYGIFAEIEPARLFCYRFNRGAAQVKEMHVVAYAKSHEN